MCNKVHLHKDSIQQCPLKERHAKRNPSGPPAASIQPDILAVSTIYTKQAMSRISDLLSWAKSTTSYKIVTRTTQPAHLAVVVAVLLLSAALYPAKEQTTTTTTKNGVYQFTYVAATAIHFGSQIWMTFISGLSLYFSLPRHDFGEVQKVLFPIYFLWSAMLSLIAVSAQARYSGLSAVTALLSLRFLLEMAVRVRCCAPLVRLISRKNAIEVTHGLGREVGKLAATSNLFESKQYLSLHHQFRRLHMVIAFANMASIGISTLHIWLSLQSCSYC